MPAAGTLRHVSKSPSQHKRQNPTEQPEHCINILQAIKYAVERWEVDVISMSFGYSSPINVINEAFEEADSNGVLMLAAASNVSGNVKKARAWLATRSKVVCIHATGGKINLCPGCPTHK
jgi:hypothetical protein